MEKVKLEAADVHVHIDGGRVDQSELKIRMRNAGIAKTNRGKTWDATANPWMAL